MLSRFYFFSVMLSICCALIVFFLFKSYAPPEPVESYAVVIVDDSEDDQFIREIIALAGTGAVISESSQEIATDNFGSLKMIPLGSFRDEIEAFDPRDDGYAARLKSFFVRDGKRYFFLPLEYGYTAASLKKRLAVFFGEIPFTITVLGERKSFPEKGLLYPLLLTLACMCAFCVAQSRRLLILTLPVLIAFSFCGPPAFAFAAILTAAWELLREPMAELSAGRGYLQLIKSRGAFPVTHRYRGIFEKLKPFRLNCFLVLVLLLVFSALCMALNLPPLPPALGLLCFFFLYFLGFRLDAMRIRKSRHVPFVPAPLLPFNTRAFSLSPLLLPYAVAAALALFLPLVFPNLSYSASTQQDYSVDPRYIISADEYYRHMDFQNSFSYSRLGALNHDAYLYYHLAEDGLIASAAQARGISGAVPGFTLEKLMDYLVNYSKPDYNRDDSEKPLGVSGIKGWFSVLIIHFVCMLNLLRPETKPGIQPLLRINKMKKDPSFRDKRAAA